MAGNDDIVDGPEAPQDEPTQPPAEISPEASAKIAELTDLAAREIGELSRLRTALAERDATIERLKAGKEAAATEIVRLVKERDEAHANHQWAQARLDHAEARAETAERERDEARAEVERLRGTRETEEAGWLVELNGERPRWWCVVRGKEPDWSTNASQALRFARKVDAEDYINEAGWTEAFASEHIWTDTRAALQQSEVKP